MERKKTTNKRSCYESVDHPHGGGEGKTSGGRSPVSPWGQSAKGLKTRRPKRSDKLIITKKEKKEKIMTRSVWKVHLYIQVY